MDRLVFLELLQDGLTTGAIYLLLALGLLIAFSVTRVIFVPQGDLLAFATLTVAAVQSGKLPGTLWLMDGLWLVGWITDILRASRKGGRGGPSHAMLLYPAAVTIAALLAPRGNAWIAMLLAIAIVTPLGPLLYRFAFRPLADASVLALLIVAMALHFVLVGLGLVFFGPEGFSTPQVTDASFDLGGINVSGQSLCVYACCVGLVLGLRWFFGATMRGKALRAAASDQLGARLVGIDQADSGRMAFALAGFVAALAGVLIGALTPISYDTGFEIGLKGFVAAIIGGLASYPWTAAGALLVGVLESFSSFWASAYRDVLVFTLLIPVLVWLSLRSRGAEDRA